MGVRFLWLFLVVGGCKILSRVQANQSARRVFAHPKQPSTAQINFFSVFDKLYINSGARYSGWGGMYYCLRFLFSVQCVRFFLQGVFFKDSFSGLQGVCLFDGCTIFLIQNLAGCMFI